MSRADVLRAPATMPRPRRLSDAAVVRDEHATAPAPLPPPSRAHAGRDGLYRPAADGPADAAMVLARSHPGRAGHTGDVRRHRRRDRPTGARLQTLFDRAIQDERLVGIALCAAEGGLVRTGGYPATVDCDGAARSASPRPRSSSEAGPSRGRPPLDGDNARSPLVLLQDLSFIDRRSHDTRRYLIVFISLLGLPSR